MSFSEQKKKVWESLSTVVKVFKMWTEPAISGNVTCWPFCEF